MLTIEDETGVANLVIWPSVFEVHRRVILTIGMLSVRGRIQREGEVGIWWLGISWICPPNSPASECGREHFRCRTDEAMKHAMADQVPIRVNCHFVD